VRNQVLRLAGALLVIGILTLALLELAGRLLDPLGVSYYPETARLYDRVILGEPLGYRLTPGMSARLYGTDVRINELGMRDRPVPQVKPAGERRVLVLGDSVPFGVGVEDDETIPRRLEVELNAGSEGSGLRYRTLNMGVPSYNTEQELIQLSTLGGQLDPDLVVLLFSTNDIEPKMWVYDKRKSLLTNLAQRSYAVSILFVLARQVRERLSGPAELIQYSSFTAENPRWQAIEQSLEAMSGITSRRGIALAVFASGQDSDPHMQLLRAAGARLGFRVIRLDLATDPEFDPANRMRFVNSVTDAHWNAAGCRIFARVIHRELVAGGYAEAMATRQSP
jgi:hypothetical protein